MGWSCKTTAEKIIGLVGTVAMAAGIMITIRTYTYKVNNNLVDTFEALKYIMICIGIGTLLYFICIVMCLIRIRACHRGGLSILDNVKSHENAIKLLNLLQCEDIITRILNDRSMCDEFTATVNALHYQIHTGWDQNSNTNTSDDSDDPYVCESPPEYPGTSHEYQTKIWNRREMEGHQLKINGRHPNSPTISSNESDNQHSDESDNQHSDKSANQHSDGSDNQHSDEPPPRHQTKKEKGKQAARLHQETKC